MWDARFGWRGTTTNQQVSLSGSNASQDATANRRSSRKSKFRNGGRHRELAALVLSSDKVLLPLPPSLCPAQPTLPPSEASFYCGPAPSQTPPSLPPSQLPSPWGRHSNPTCPVNRLAAAGSAGPRAAPVMAASPHVGCRRGPKRLSVTSLPGWDFWLQISLCRRQPTTLADRPSAAVQPISKVLGSVALLIELFPSLLPPSFSGITSA